MRITIFAIIGILLIAGFANATQFSIPISDSGEPPGPSNQQNYPATADNEYLSVFDNQTIFNYNGTGTTLAVNAYINSIHIDQSQYRQLGDNEKISWTVSFVWNNSETLTYITSIQEFTGKLLWWDVSHKSQANTEIDINGIPLCFENTVTPYDGKSPLAATFKFLWGIPFANTTNPFITIQKSGFDGFDYEDCKPPQTPINGLQYSVSANGLLQLNTSAFVGPFDAIVYTASSTLHDDTVMTWAQTNETANLTSASFCGSNGCNGATAASCSALDVSVPGWMTAIVSALTFGKVGITHICFGDFFQTFLGGVFGLFQSVLQLFFKLIPGSGFLYGVITTPFTILAGILQIFSDIFLYSGVPYGVAGLYFAHVVLFLTWGFILFGYTGRTELIYKPVVAFVKITWGSIIYLAIIFYTKILPWMIDIGEKIVSGISNFFSNMIP